MVESARDVTVKTRFADAQALLSIVEVGIARGALRIPAEIALGPTFEVSLLTAAGELAIRGTAEAIRHDGATTLVRFLSATEGRDDQNAWIDLDDAVVTVPPMLARRMLPPVPPLGKRSQRRAAARERGDWNGALGTPEPVEVGEAPRPTRTLPPLPPVLPGARRTITVPPLVSGPPAALPQYATMVDISAPVAAPVLPAVVPVPTVAVPTVAATVGSDAVPAAAPRTGTSAPTVVVDVATVPVDAAVSLAVFEAAAAPTAANDAVTKRAFAVDTGWDAPERTHDAVPRAIARDTEPAPMRDAEPSGDPLEPASSLAEADAELLSEGDIVPLVDLKAAAEPAPAVEPAAVFSLPFGASITIPPPLGGVATTIALPFGAAITIPPQYRGGTTVPPPFGSSTTVPPPFGSSTTVPPPFGSSTTMPPPFGSSTTVPPPFGATAASEPVMAMWPASLMSAPAAIPAQVQAGSRAARGVLGASIVIAVAGAAVAVSAVMWARSVSSTRTGPAPASAATAAPLAAAAASAVKSGSAGRGTEARSVVAAVVAPPAPALAVPAEEAPLGAGPGKDAPPAAPIEVAAVAAVAAPIVDDTFIEPDDVAIAPDDDAHAPAAIDPAILLDQTATGPIATGPCRVTLSSNADGATIFIDGVRRGETPATLALPCTAATLVLKHPRYQLLTRRIEPRPEGAAVVSAMARPKARLKIVTRPSGAVVTMGSHTVGKTPLVVTVDGYERQSVTLTAPGFVPERRSVYVRGEASVVAATLRRK